MELWFETREVWALRHRAESLLEGLLETGESPFPRGHECPKCDREIRLLCIAWAGIGIEVVGPARNYTSHLYDAETGQPATPDEFIETPAGRAAVWASRLMVAVGNANMELVDALTVDTLEDLDMRADCLMHGVAHLTREKARILAAQAEAEELRRIEERVLAEMGQGPRFVSRFPEVPTPPLPMPPAPPKWWNR